EHSNQPIAYGARNERCGDCGVHTSADCAQGAAIADLLADAVNGVLDEGSERPVAAATAHIKDETAQQAFAVCGVGNFGVELNSENFLGRTLHCGYRVLRSRGHIETRRWFQNAVPMAHPYAPHAVQERRRLYRIEFTRSVFSVHRWFDTAAKLSADELHSI